MYFSINFRIFTKSRFHPLKLNNMQSDEFVVLAEYNTLAEAEIAKSILQSAGLWVDIRNEFMSALNSIGGAATIVVRSKDRAEAEQLLKVR